MLVLLHQYVAGFKANALKREAVKIKRMPWGGILFGAT